MKSSKSTGFSLVELLITMTILIMVLFIGTMAYRQYSVYWHKEMGQFDEKLQTAKNIVQIHSIIKNIRPHMVKFEENVWGHYFEGASTLIRSVTEHAISQPGNAAIFELSVVADGESRTLVYREKPIVESPFFNYEADHQYTYEKRFDFRFDELQFEYFGWRHVDEYFTALESPDRFSQAWYGAYSGRDSMVTPNIIRITIAIDNRNSLLEVPVLQFIPEYIQNYGQGNE
ncbi:type II secretion system protein [Planctobacterium marinum]|uniref:type II secretion system protein n=1 Tax=Planctobacterium marinum TaxID=1631968 RepID=UPI001E5ED586|nr:prepilin-type N-terminal cleavage/methylation domain-containing protein [Planctobacterium marinum]MCC2606156.1 prepilin-type N-terminal cleavage/methylation domain-containing protein [Planctobacterium marinum]